MIAVVAPAARVFLERSPGVACRRPLRSTSLADAQEGAICRQTGDDDHRIDLDDSV